MNVAVNRKIILASQSPRRKELLESLGIDFKVLVSDVDEETLKEKIKNPKALVSKLSYIKAEVVSKSEEISSENLIVAADTLVEYNGEILGKPKDELDAMRMLKLLNGKKHNVYTGMTLIDMQTMTKKTIVEKVKVYFHKVSDDVIIDYIKSGECMDKAGAYAIQGDGKVFIKKIEGDYNSVIGLPVSRLFLELTKVR